MNFVFIFVQRMRDSRQGFSPIELPQAAQGESDAHHLTVYTELSDTDVVADTRNTPTKSMHLTSNTKKPGHLCK